MSSTTVYVSRGKQARPGVRNLAAPEGRRFRPDIEGMRAVAVVLVVLYHAGIAPFTGGYVGVDVFFVISGFLITRMLFDELAMTRSISFARFYARRATRLLPASTLVIAVTVVASRLWLSPTRLHSINLDALASLGYGINFRMAAAGINYLNAGAPPSPLQHLWSLAVEEQFYVVWPAMLFICSFAWRWRQNTFKRSTVVASVIVIVCGSFALSVWQTKQAAPWAYFGTQTRAWELASGSLVALALPSLARMNRAIAAIVTWAGLVAIVSAALVFNDSTAFPGYAAALPVLGAVAVIAGGSATPRWGVDVVLGLRPLQEIGKLSYGWYLWHWPALMIVPVALNVTASPLLNLGIAVAALGLAFASYHLVENPIRHDRRLTAIAWKGIGVGALASTLVAAGTMLALVYGPSLSGVGQAVDTRSTLASAPNPATALASLLAAGLTSEDVPRNLAPTLSAAANDSPIVYANGCHLGFTETWPAGPCVFGDVTATKTVVLFGDSHAAQWFPALDIVAKAQHWRLLSYTKSACPAASVLVYQAALKRAYNECVVWRNRVFAMIKSIHPDMVVMANNGTDDGGIVNLSGNADQAWASAWSQTVTAVKPYAQRIVMISDTAYPKSDVPDCVSSHLKTVSACINSRTAALVLPTRRQAIATAVGGQGVQIVDPTDWLCTATECPVIVGNVLVYKDDSHMSVEYSSALAPLLAAALR